MRFSDGKIRMIAVGDTAKVREAFPDAEIVKPHRARTMMGRPLESSIAQGLSDWAPMAGGIAGSTVGGPLGSAAGALLGAPGGPPGMVAGSMAGGVAGRSLGGMAGGGLGQAAREGVYAAGGEDAPGSVGQEMKNQAILGGIGELGAGGVNLLGRAAIRTGLPSRVMHAGKAVGEMVKKRLPVGGIRTKGSVKSGKNLGAARDARDAANTAAGAQGAMIPSRPMEQKMLDMADEFNLRGDRSAQLAALGRRMDDFVETWRSGSLSPNDAQVYLSSLDDEATSLWNAQSKGYVPDAERKAAQQAKKIAGVLRAEMRKRVPGHEAKSAAVSSAAAAHDAIKAAEHQSGHAIAQRLAAGAAIGGTADFLSGERHPGKLTGASLAGGALLSSPAALSRLGLTLTDPRLMALLRQAPRGYRSGSE